MKKESALQQWISLRHEARGFRKSDSGRKAGRLERYRWEASSSKVCIEDWEFARSIKIGTRKDVLLDNPHWMSRVSAKIFSTRGLAACSKAMPVSILEFLNDEGNWVRAANYSKTWSLRILRVWRWKEGRLYCFWNRRPTEPTPKEGRLAAHMRSFIRKGCIKGSRFASIKYYLLGNPHLKSMHSWMKSY